MVKRFSWCVFGRINVLHRRLWAHTLLELLLVLLLVSGLSFAGIYGWRQLVARQQWHTQLDQMTELLRFARSAAHDRQQVITLCGSQSGRQCDGNWQAGVLVVAAANDVLWYWSRKGQITHLSWYSSLGWNHYLKFAPSGFTLGQQGRFYLCADRKMPNQASRALVVSQSGRVRLSAGPKVKQYCQMR